MKIQLANWIGHQLGFMDLFESILSILSKEPRPEKVASQIFAYTNYLTKPEREAVCERIRKNSLLSLNERRKMRADYYVVEKIIGKPFRTMRKFLSRRITIRRKKSTTLCIISDAAIRICFILIWLLNGL